MKLIVADRLSLMGLLPKEGTFITLKLIRKLKETLSFNDSEIAALEFKHGFECPTCKRQQNFPPTVTTQVCPVCHTQMKGNGMISWNPDKDPNKEIVLGKAMEQICVGALQELNNAKKLTEQYMGLYEKFGLGGEDT